MSKHYVLYRVYGGDRLLYIGQTSQPNLRFRKHAEAKDWWPGVTSIELEHFRSRDDLERAEQAAIRTERPALNVQHNPMRPAPEEVRMVVPYYDDGDPEDPYSEYYEPDLEPGEEAHYVIEEYLPSPPLTPEEEAEGRAAADIIGRILASIPNRKLEAS